MSICPESLGTFEINHRHAFSIQQHPRKRKILWQKQVFFRTGRRKGPWNGRFEG
jgi:hypothetical protein